MLGAVVSPRLVAMSGADLALSLAAASNALTSYSYSVSLERPISE